MYTAQEFLYYPIVFLGLVYIFYKFNINKLSVMVVLIFWAGMFASFGTGIFNLYKIFIVAYTVLCIGTTVTKMYSKNEERINLFFILFTVIFFLSYIIYGGDIITILSQYGYKYGMVFLIYHLLKDVPYNQEKREYLKYLLLHILYVQIVLSIYKLIMFGFSYESIVGSVAHAGGGIAVPLPVVGLIFYWIIRQGSLKKGDWLMVCAFLLIAVASGKRSPMIMYPVFIFLLFSYVKGGVALSSALKYSPVVIAIFIIGMKLIPSLNPEGQIWGSFDIAHVFKYAVKYNFRVDEPADIFRDDYVPDGRIGGLVTIFTPARMGMESIDEITIGKGLYVYARADKRQLFTEIFDVDRIGSLGAVPVELFKHGYLGFISIFIFCILIISTIKQKRLRNVVLALYFWELFLYGNQVMFNNASAILVVFSCFYANTFDLKLNNRTP